MFSYDKHLKITGIPLWLDATRRVDACVVSHAHMDHARKHAMTLATAATLALLEKRIGLQRALVLTYGEAHEFCGTHITLFPAGHILGSAQVLVEIQGKRLLYSGDFALKKALTAEPIQIPESDTLIMECTFGRPRYRFPDRTEVIHRLVDFIESALAAGVTPVVAGYSLGKTQEVMKILGDAGYRLSVHGSVARLARVYQEHGVVFQPWENFNRNDLEGKVVVVPRIALKSRQIRRIENRRTVFLTGWAVNPAIRQRYEVDEALPLSDHADFDDLIEYVRRVRPRKIYTTHGHKDFSLHLRNLGFDAKPLSRKRQLSLFEE